MEDEKEMICDKSFSAWLQADPYTYIRPYTLALENPRGVGVKTNILYIELGSKLLLIFQVEFLIIQIM